MAPCRSKTTEAIGQLYKAHQMREHANVLQRVRDPFAATCERIDAQKLEAAEEVLKMPEIARTPPDGGEIALFGYPDPADMYTGGLPCGPCR